MKRIALFALIIFAIFTLLMSVAAAQQTHATAAKADLEKHGFGVKAYDAFHDVLHPLEHEALPKKDFKTIRAKAGELAKAGNAIVKTGTPAGVKDRAEFTKELKAFRKALLKYGTDARKGTDDQLKASYSAVHDSFEMLASMLPRKQ